ncbi:hypothetical protein [Agromyces badenianii]|uniref:hypothetical protein n=1 Tax=Agromyces badenianii TaxID=2080742 RepID=UPI000D5920C1|nr:hypothetical protein [Agromyces badenianii]PWC05421.1 hypothetical protein DCE94_03875 [Agromyces badenianii]
MARDEPRWHPFLATEERTPGVWTLVDTLGRDYGRVSIVRIGAEVGYVGELQDAPVGRWKTLRAAIEAVHHAFVASHAPGGFAPNPWPSTQKSAPTVQPKPNSGGSR